MYRRDREGIYRGIVLFDIVVLKIVNVICKLVTLNKTKNKMIVTTSETIPGKEVSELLGICRGSTVRARNLGRDIFAGLKNIVGGEIHEYTQLQAEAREQALQRMIADAQTLGADAIINIRMHTSMIMQGASEILVYGTAVRTK